MARAARWPTSRRQLPLMLTSMAPDDPATSNSSAGTGAAAILTAPLGAARRSNAAVQATVAKECV